MKTTILALTMCFFGFLSLTKASDLNFSGSINFQKTDEEPEHSSVLRKRLNLEFGYGIPGTALWTTPPISSNSGWEYYPSTYIAPFEFNQKENTPFYAGATYSFLNHLEVGVHYNFSDFRYDSGIHLKEKSHAIKVRVSFYRNIGEHVEFYTGLGLGIRFGTYNIVYTDTLFGGQYRTESGHIENSAFEITAGFRLFLMPEIAWYVEAGINRSLLQTGMLIKFDFDE